MQDAKLIRKYAEDASEDAFRVIVTRYLNLVYATCLRELGERQAAEDATQAVFVLLAQKAGRMNRNVVLAGWLFKAARLVSRNAARTERRREAMLRNVARLAESATSTATEADLSEQLNDAVGRLGAADRDAILLRFYQSLTLAEIGTELGISEDAAQKRVARAVERLRSSFATAGVAVVSVALVDFLIDSAAQAAPGQGFDPLPLAGGGSGSGLGVAHLVHGATREMTRTKIATAFAALTGVGVILGAIGTGYAHYASVRKPAVDAGIPRPSAPIIVGPGKPAAVLPDGTVVELLGLTAGVPTLNVNGRSHSPGGWWTPTGTPMPDPPSTPALRPNRAVQTVGDVRTLCFRLTPPRADDILTTQGSASGYSPAGFNGLNTITMARRQMASVAAGVPAYGLFTASLPPSNRKFTYRLGVGTGPWRVVSQIPMRLHPRLGDIFISRDPNLTAGANFTLDDNPTIYYLDQNRVVHQQALLPPGDSVADCQLHADAFDAQGRIVDASAQYGAWEPADFLRIATMRLTARPWRWLEFRDVANVAAK